MYTNFDLDKFIKDFVVKRKESLLKKDLEKFNTELTDNLYNKKILVIGGAGTIGSSYIKALLKFKVKSLIVVDINENGLTELVRDVRSSSDNFIPSDFITYPVNVGDKIFEKIFKYHGPFDIVANFAAHKHVRSEKDIFSIEAMVKNNIFVAKQLLDLLVNYPPEHFFCVSTDKAANPVNIMGASKKLMEEIIMAYSGKLNITTARFANVAFSNGSLPLGFIHRINKNQPISCPKEINRFFVSDTESGELCLIASLLGNSGDIIYPKLDEGNDIISFEQILVDLIHQLGIEVDYCNSEDEAKFKAQLLTENSKKYPIFFSTSNTSGEKSYEEFYTDEEERDTNYFINLGIIKNNKTINLDEVEVIIKELSDCFQSNNAQKDDVIKLFNKYLPSFSHIEKGKNLDSVM